MRFKLVDEPRFGDIVELDAVSGKFRYRSHGTAPAGTRDRFTFVVSDGALTSSPAFVDIDMR